jgi:hypothetical protein
VAEDGVHERAVPVLVVEEAANPAGTVGTEEQVPPPLLLTPLQEGREDVSNRRRIMASELNTVELSRAFFNGILINNILLNILLHTIGTSFPGLRPTNQITTIPGKSEQAA